MAAKSQSVFVCQSCGYKAPRWQGRCSECSAWNTLVEEKVERASSSTKRSSDPGAGINSRLQELKPLFAHLENAKQIDRVSSGFKEINRVLGGGFVPGSLLLFGGEPGIGKSTLLLQIVGNLVQQGVSALYVSGEESGPQVAARAKRLEIGSKDNLQFYSTASLDEALHVVSEAAPQVLVVDSVQTLGSSQLESAPGTVSQVREVTQSLLEVAKGKGILTLLVGHLTKEGTLAGPKLLEHMVDGVFYFEQSATSSFRLLRAQKNRFGSTQELAVMEMFHRGLKEIPNPSERFLAERAKEMAGSAVVAHLEGSRPFLTEVQALTQRCYQGYPRRTVQGIDQNRLAVLLAIIEKSLDIPFADLDVYCKVASGARVEEPAADLPILFALVSAALNRAISSDVLLMGEVGLGGELRSIPGLSARIVEGASVGLCKMIVPKSCIRDWDARSGIEVIGASNIREVAKILEFQ